MDSVEDIDARLDELTNAIHDAMSASAPKIQPAKQPLVSIPPTILANIRTKNRLRRQWQIDRDPATKNRKGGLQSSSRSGGMLNGLIRSSLCVQRTNPCGR